MKPVPGQLAVVLPVTLFLGTVVLGFAAVRHLSGVACVRACTVLCVYALWIAFETSISIRERKEESPQDKGTLKLYALGQGITVLSALGFFCVEPADFLAWIGVGLFLVVVAVRVCAIRTLGTL